MIPTSYMKQWARLKKRSKLSQKIQKTTGTANLLRAPPNSRLDTTSPVSITAYPPYSSYTAPSVAHERRGIQHTLSTTSISGFQGRSSSLQVVPAVIPVAGIRAAYPILNRSDLMVEPGHGSFSVFPPPPTEMHDANISPVLSERIDAYDVFPKENSNGINGIVPIANSSHPVKQEHSTREGNGDTIVMAEKGEHDIQDLLQTVPIKQEPNTDVLAPRAIGDISDYDSVYSLFTENDPQAATQGEKPGRYPVSLQQTILSETQASKKTGVYHNNQQHMGAMRAQVNFEYEKIEHRLQAIQEEQDILDKEKWLILERHAALRAKYDAAHSEFTIDCLKPRQAAARVTETVVRTEALVKLADYVDW